MKTSYPPVLTKQYQRSAPQWLEALRQDESIAVLFFPKTDRLRRIQQLMEDKSLLNKYLGSTSKYIFEIIDLSTVNIEDYFDLQDYLTKYMNYERIVSGKKKLDDCVKFLKKQDQRLVIVLHRAEQYLDPSTKKIFSFISQLVSEFSPHIIVVSLFETNITHPALLSLLPPATALYDNLFYYPVYSREEGLVFIKYLQQKWQKKIDPKKEQEIADRCGGHFWLIKEAVREVVNTGEWSIDLEGIQFRLNSIYSGLLPNEQSLLHKIGTQNLQLTVDEEKSMHYLKKMQIIGEDGQNLIPLLQQFILTQNDLSKTLTLQNGRIVLNKVPIDRLFSKKEHRILKLLLEQKGKIVPRSAIGDKMWPVNTQNEYSDWAIDQTVARLRRRLGELSLPPEAIQVVRGKGYKLILN